MGARSLSPALAALALLLAGCSGAPPQVSASSLPPPPPPVAGAPVAPLLQEPHIVLLRSDHSSPQQQEPLLLLELRQPGREPVRLWAVSGRRRSQDDALRHTSGSRSPLPAGRYQIHSPEEILPGDPPELGRSGWIAVSPLFPTGRSALGFHHDPSFDLPNGESGTDGCIGLVSPADARLLMRWVADTRPRLLIVAS